MLFLLIIIGPLVVWRMTHMLQEEDGPGAVFARLRAWVATNTSSEPGGVNDGFSCFKCLSVWVAGLYCLFLGLNLFEWVVVALAISAAAIFINSAYSKHA